MGLQGKIILCCPSASWETAPGRDSHTFDTSSPTLSRLFLLRCTFVHGISTRNIAVLLPHGWGCAGQPSPYQIWVFPNGPKCSPQLKTNQYQHLPGSVHEVGLDMEKPGLVMTQPPKFPVLHTFKTYKKIIFTCILFR